MKLFVSIALFVLIACGVEPLLAFSGSDSNGNFSFPLDGGRKLMPIVNPQKGKGIAIGYLTVSSVDNQGALNSAADQQSVNQLMSQINDLYVQIFNQLSTQQAPQVGPPARLPNSCPQNSPVPTGTSQRRTPRWR